MATIVGWKEEFNLGLNEIDAQHQSLFEIINKLWDAIVSRKEQSELLRLIDELEHYTLAHFAAEETFMRITEFEQFDAHKAAHQKFVARVASEKKKVQAGEQLTLDLLHFLREWLVNHILIADKAYAEQSRYKKNDSFLGKLFKRFW